MMDSVDALLAAVREHGLRLSAVHGDLDESGGDFVVAHAEDEGGVAWVVRAPRRADARERMGLERRALELLRGRLPVGLPEWRVYAPEVVAYPRLAGEPAAVTDAGGERYVWRFDAMSPPAALLGTLAAVMAALHAIDPAEAVATGLPALSPDGVRQALARQMEQTRSLLAVPEPVWRRWQTWLADDSYWPAHTSLIHGDLQPGHVLVDDEHRVTGLLDWTEARVSDPATDFSLFYDALGPAVLADLIARYAGAGGRVWPRMHEHVVERSFAYAVTAAQWALLTGEEEHRRFGQRVLDENARRMAEEG